MEQRRLPPLNSLRAFEVAARHLSFKQAAEELSVTPAAISQQVKQLEAYYEVRLFERLTRALALTEAGQAILPVLKEGFDKLAEADSILRMQNTAHVISISVAPLLSLWLLPRLERFRRFAPDYEIRVDASELYVDFAREGMDLALRFGLSSADGLIVEPLFKERPIVVCSPSLREDAKYPLNEPDDIRHHTLLHSTWRMENKARVNWRMWIKVTGVKGVNAEAGPRFNWDTMVLQAANRGQGLALLDESIVREDIAQGRLVRLFADAGGEENLAPGLKYYLVYPEVKRNDPKVICFREWLLKEVENNL